jgi:hypothetical protein
LIQGSFCHVSARPQGAAISNRRSLKSEVIPPPFTFLLLVGGWVIFLFLETSSPPGSPCTIRLLLGIGRRLSENLKMTAAEFRKIALSFPEAVEASHVAHPDFRVGGRIFATLGYPDECYGVLMLTPDEQQELIGRYPEMFDAVKGGWGRRGSTQVLLQSANRRVLESAMQRAWRKRAPKRLLQLL